MSAKITQISVYHFRKHTTKIYVRLCKAMIKVCFGLDNNKKDEKSFINWFLDTWGQQSKL